MLALHSIGLVDYPNHLAEMFIRLNLATDEALRGIYVIRPGFFPYWGLFGPFYALDFLGDVETIGRVYCVLAVSATPIGVLVLSKALSGRVQLPGLLGAVFALNAATFWGFLNFQLVLGLLLIGVAAHERARALPPVWRLALSGAIMVVLGVLHPIGAAIYLMLVLSLDLATVLERRGTSLLPALRRSSWKTIAIIAAASAFGLLAAFHLVRAYDFSPQRFEYGGVSERVLGALSPFSTGASLEEMLIGLAKVLVLAGAYYIGAFKVPARFRLPLGIMVVLSILSPQILAGVYYTHYRVPIACLAFLLASTTVAPERGQAAALRIASALGVLALVHAGLVYGYLRDADHRITILREGAAIIPSGARVLPVLDAEEQNAAFLAHAASYLAIDRKVFIPTLFGMYDIGVRDDLAPLFPAQTGPVPAQCLQTTDPAANSERAADLPCPAWAIARNFDFIVEMTRDETAAHVAGARVVVAGEGFRIYAVER